MSLWSAACAVTLALTGCMPPGPRALLEGDRLVREGKPREAIHKLEAVRKLMERDPRFWNCLGLAYHGAGEFPRAAEAYRYALALDRSNLVFVAHYNLGCLFLEQGNASAAVNELRSFCMLSNSWPAYLKLGEAEFLMRQLDAAERAFANVLRIRPTEPAAFNGLGLVQLQRNRPRDAAQFFQNALRIEPKFAPALLNLAVAYQQQPSQRAAAAQKYREYLALEPRPANSEVVLSTLRRLEHELAPPPVATPINGAALLAARTNGANPATNAPAVVTTTSATHHTAVVAATNAFRATTNVVRPVPDLAKAAAPPVAPTTTHIARTSIVSPPPAPPTVTVINLSNEPPIRPARDVVIASLPSTSAPVPIVEGSSPATGSNFWIVRAAPTKTEKRGFLQSLNPFRSKPKPPPATNTIVVPRTRATEIIITSPPPTSVGVPPYAGPRYVYLLPARPVAGDRRAAEPFFQQGFRAQQEGQIDTATRAYRAALEKDPAYYEAYYNLALLAFQVTDWKAALHAYEMALALVPESVHARLGFGLALERASYPQDAAGELEKVVRARPEEVRAHLTLGNLYAQRLGQPARAREHYLKVLELDPRHPQSSAIRYWLAARS